MVEGMLFPAAYLRPEPMQTGPVLTEVAEDVWFVLDGDGDPFLGPYSTRTDAHWALRDFQDEIEDRWECRMGGEEC